MQQCEYPNIGATELVLSNGMRVCYKSTDFLDDQVQLCDSNAISVVQDLSKETLSICNAIFVYMKL